MRMQHPPVGLSPVLFLSLFAQLTSQLGPAELLLERF